MKKVLSKFKLLSIIGLLLFSIILSVVLAPALGISTGLLFVITIVLFFIASVGLPAGVLGVNTFDLTKTTLENPGGCATQWYWAFWDDVLTWPVLPAASTLLTGDPALMAALTGQFVMKSTTRFWKGYGTLDTVSIEDDSVGPMDSKSFKNVFKCEHPGVKALLSGWLRMVQNRSLVIIASDSAGIMRVVGNSNYGANLTEAKGTTGAKVEDGNKSTISFESYNVCPAPSYTGTVPLTPAV